MSRCSLHQRVNELWNIREIKGMCVKKNHYRVEDLSPFTWACMWVIESGVISHFLTMCKGVIQFDWKLFFKDVMQLFISLQSWILNFCRWKVSIITEINNIKSKKKEKIFESFLSTYTSSQEQVNVISNLSQKLSVNFTWQTKM